MPTFSEILVGHVVSLVLIAQSISRRHKDLGAWQLAWEVENASIQGQPVSLYQRFLDWQWKKKFRQCGFQKGFTVFEVPRQLAGLSVNDWRTCFQNWAKSAQDPTSMDLGLAWSMSQFDELPMRERQQVVARSAQALAQTPALLNLLAQPSLLHQDAPLDWCLVIWRHAQGQMTTPDEKLVLQTAIMTHPTWINVVMSNPAIDVIEALPAWQQWVVPAWAGQPEAAWQKIQASVKEARVNSWAGALMNKKGGAALGQAMPALGWLARHQSMEWWADSTRIEEMDSMLSKVKAEVQHQGMREAWVRPCEEWHGRVKAHAEAGVLRSAVKEVRNDILEPPVSEPGPRPRRRL